MKAAATALIAALLSGAPAAADDPAALAGAAMERLAQAADAHSAAETRADRVAALTATVRAYEDGLAALRAGLRQAAAAEARLGAALEARSGEVSRLLGALAGIERAPPALTLLHPAGPVGTARAAMMLGEVTPAMQAEAERLRRDLAEIRALRDVQRGAQETLEEALRAVQQARTDLSQAIAERIELPRRFDADPERLRDLVAASDTLAAFVAGLGTLEAKAAPPPSPEARPPGSGPPRWPPRAGRALPLPAAGVVLRRFGEADASGTARPGVTLATRPAALVTAPVSSTVRYAGPLLDYGNVMILEPEADTLLVLSGLGTLYGRAGQIVAAGDPLGLMDGASAPPAAGLVDSTGVERSETLYIEVRRGETPVDPAGWFAIDRQE
ncbi:peptidase M23 [Rhodovulum sp. 12E13]|uniref:murein hydrolase activator EnvC family protein n=1 Tax=Rhodovulum sp. 12E13 TaxID=2203891 RepID=UPI000E154A95|nr:peptidoglycan DD-metalloendopeptidase family protein [Rhodovulum sp. 12E13]RDC74910.1 peptidase M23 [Rhodovulum sp. 12E13]